MSADDWDAVLDLNLRGTFLVTKAALRPMMKQRSGRIVNVASVAGVMGNAGQANYAAAKAGLIAFTKTVAREMASRNITANAVAPGLIPTELTAPLPQAVKDAMLAQTPLGRFGTVEDVASVVAFHRAIRDPRFWDEIRDLAAWLRTAVSRRAITRVRRRQLWSRLLPRLHETATEYDETTVDVRRALQTLPIQQRAAIVLRYYA